MPTIAAISTPRAAGGISVIRISGPGALEAAGKIFIPVSAGKAPSEMEGYTCAYGKITDGENIIDDVVLTVFRAPKSYTGEDTAEISCHGGIYVSEKILRLIYENGVSPAGPGEFTKRAFLNGKLSLIQAEAVMDVISAKGEASLRAASALREGALFRRIGAVKTDLLKLSGELAAWADFPEDDIPGVEDGAVLTALNSGLDRLYALYNSYDGGRIIREGIDAVIAGKPNAGKSSLMNLLSGSERSIVADTEGTTRDIIEETVRLGDLILRLSDTAGLRGASDAIEKAGVKKAEDKINAAELVLAVFDGSSPLSCEDLSLIESLKNKNAVALINKSDLPQLIDFDFISERFEYKALISAKENTGVDSLKKEIERLFKTGLIDVSEGILANERQRACVSSAIQPLEEAIKALKSGITLDAVTILIDQALNSLLELTGERVTDAVADEIFASFCVGK